MSLHTKFKDPKKDKYLRSALTSQSCNNPKYFLKLKENNILPTYIHTNMQMHSYFLKHSKGKRIVYHPLWRTYYDAKAINESKEKKIYRRK